jgi:hypothetical protein
MGNSAVAKSKDNIPWVFSTTTFTLLHPLLAQQLGLHPLQVLHGIRPLQRLALTPF